MKEEEKRERGGEEKTHFDEIAKTQNLFKVSVGVWGCSVDIYIYIYIADWLSGLLALVSCEICAG